MAGRQLALVTGAAGGIGHATARLLLHGGFDVAMAGIEAAPLLPMPPASSGTARYYPFDLADIDGHAALLERISHEMGAVDCLVNNAGVTSLTRGDMLDLTPESFDRALAVNLRGTFFLTQRVARRMLEGAGGAQRSIVTIGSVNAEILGGNRADYCMTKAALAMMSRLFAARLAAAGIAVFEIRPGIIRTAMTAPAGARYDALVAAGGVPQARWGEPEDVARAVVSLASGAIPYATGIHVDVAGGLQLHRV